jgi:hypothetical protein
MRDKAKAMKRGIISGLLLIMFILVFTMPKINALDTQLGDKTYTINFPKNDFFMVSSLPRIYIQVQNYTGLFLIQPIVECRIQVYNSFGSIVSSTMMAFEQPYNFYFDLPANTSSHVGIYPYDVYCNSTTAGGFASSNLRIGETSEKQGELPVSVTLALLGVFLFTLFFASYFAVQKHPLVYLFTIFAFLFADVLIWLNWRILNFNGSPISGVFYALYLGMLLITFVMAIVTMLDVTRMVIVEYKKKEAAKNIARFGYA